jgi:hypothetical protein
MKTATRYPWRKWYPAAYLTDPRIMFLSLAARGLLVEVEALCYVAETPGKLTIQKRPMTAAEIARVRGVEVGQVESALAELLDAELLHKDGDGCIVSPSLRDELQEREDTRDRVDRHRTKHRPDDVTANVTDGVTRKSRVEKNQKRKEGASRPRWQIEKDVEAVKRQRNQTFERMREAARQHGCLTHDEISNGAMRYGSPADVEAYHRQGEKLKQLKTELETAA